MGGVQMDVDLSDVWVDAPYGIRRACGVCRCACGTSGGNASVCDVNGCCASGNDANGCDVKWMWYVMKDVAMGPAAMAKDSPVLANRSEEANLSKCRCLSRPIFY